MAGIEGLLSGHTLAGRYRIEEVIGRGGFAAVYRAEDERLRRVVAVKVVMLGAPDEESRARIRSRFHREARAAAQLQHPNVVTIYDYGTDEGLGLDFLVMELLHGEDLAGHVSRLGPPPMELSLRIVREAAEGLAAGHRAGLVHRDVKPGNIFLEERSGIDVFRVCVLDFGIAQILAGEETLTALTRGHMPLSPAYASPEHLRDERPLTPAADVYGLGVIGYELLTGERLFKNGVDESARRNVPPLRSVNPEVPAVIAAVIDRAMAFAPGDRYADAAAMAQALVEAQARHDVPTVEPVSPLPTPAASLPDQDQEPEGSRKYRARKRPRLPDEAASVVAPAIRHGPRRSALPIVLVGVAALLLAAWWAFGRGEGSDPRPTAGVERPAEQGRTIIPGAAPGGDGEVVGGLAGSGDSGEAAAVADGAPAEPDPVPGGGGAATGGGSSDALHAEGLRLFQAGSLVAAIERLGAAAERAPRNASVRNDLGWALFQAGRLDEAERELEEVIRLDPQREIAYANLGEVHLARGDTAEAIRLYERFLEINDDPGRERIAQRKLARIRG